MIHDERPWSERYRPKSIKDIVGNHEAIQHLMRWISTWNSGVPPRRAILLVGPPGVGKTSVVGALAMDLDVELVEFNASDKRNKTVIETHVWRSATQQTITGERRIILLDEVDGMSGTGDRGGLAAIIDIIEQTVHPIIMTANDEESTAVKELRSKKICEIIRFLSLSSSEIMIVLNRIVQDMGIDIDERVIENIAESAAGDMRAAISDLETVADGGAPPNITGRPIRDSRHTIQTVLGRLFMTKDASAARMLISEEDIDYEELLLWLEENLSNHLANELELDEGFEMLSAADLSLGRISRRQNWQLLAYVYDFLSAGIAFSRTVTPFRKVEYVQPNWPLLVWQGSRYRDKMSKLLSKLSTVASISQERAMRIYTETIRRIIERRRTDVTIYADWLGINKALFDTRKGH